MRFALALLIVLNLTSVAVADEAAAANRLRYAGIGVLVAGVVATIVAQVLVGEGKSWEFGNGLGEHYDPTPAWVPRFEDAGWGLLAGGQVAILSGIAMLGVGDTNRDLARGHALSFSLTPSRSGAMASVVARF